MSWLVPADRLGGAGQPTVLPLDIAREKQRYGGSTLGGVGVSTPTPTPG